MTLREVLVEARGLIAHGWTQYAVARDTYEQPVPATSTDACRWCATGAITRAVRLANESDLLFMAAVGAVAPNRSITRWNDAPGRTQAEVLEAFDSAIERAER